MLPAKSARRYEPRVFGFRVHAAAALQRWQEERKEVLVSELKKVGVETGFVEDLYSEESSGEDEEEEDVVDEIPPVPTIPSQGMQL